MKLNKICEKNILAGSREERLGFGFKCQRILFSSEYFDAVNLNSWLGDFWLMTLSDWFEPSGFHLGDQGEREREEMVRSFLSLALYPSQVGD